MFHAIRHFLKLEASASILLALATLLALIAANSDLSSLYNSMLHTPINLPLFPTSFSRSLLFWINDGFMVLFFFLIGLEIKRECIQGHLSIPAQRILPATATIGGICIPALLFILCNQSYPTHLKGWAIPTATDIAFALGVLRFIHPTPQALKIFLLTIAVLDDLAAVLIIAIFYTTDISAFYLMGAACVWGLLIIMNRFNIQHIVIYSVASIILWTFVLLSGIHPTIAGVLAALTFPFHRDSPKNTCIILEQTLHPWVAYLILPLFAFVNSGLPLKSITITHLTNPLTLGIILGLFFGKQLGVFIGTWIPIQLKWVQLPKQISWRQLYGMSILCGIGFTMSLFISTLAFNESTGYAHQIKLGILIASLSAMITGYGVLKVKRP